MSTLELKELSHPSGEVIKIAAGKTLDLKSQGSVAMPSGSVLQVIQVGYNTTVGSTTNTFVDTGLTATITPSSTSSKILVTFNQQGVGKWSNNTSCSLRLIRGSTQLQIAGDYTPYTSSGLEVRGLSVTSQYLDSPSTTSATTYKVQFRSLNNNATAAVNDPQGNSTITLMEIAQ
jgi:hypothetical protein